MTTTPRQPVELDVRQPLWERFFMVAPLVLIGTREPDGRFDLAPKHMALPLGWQNYFGFVCTPRHSTYFNVARERAFTVSFPRPDQVLETSLAASGRCDDGSKPVVATLATVPARRMAGVLVAGATLQLECELERIVDGFGVNSLVAGRVVAAYADPAALREADRAPEDVLAAAPLLAYLHPGRFASIATANSFPFPEDMRK